MPAHARSRTRPASLRSRNARTRGTTSYKSEQWLSMGNSLQHAFGIEIDPFKSRKLESFKRSSLNTLRIKSRADRVTSSIRIYPDALIRCCRRIVIAKAGLHRSRRVTFFCFRESRESRDGDDSSLYRHYGIIHRYSPRSRYRRSLQIRIPPLFARPYRIPPVADLHLARSSILVTLRSFSAHV
jgi:hypothetical protein